MNNYSYLNQYLLDMYITAVESGRIIINFVSYPYRHAVADILDIELNEEE